MEGLEPDGGGPKRLRLANLLAVAALLAIGLLAVNMLSGRTSQSELPEVGRLLPAFDLPRLEGDRVTNADLRRKPAFLNFWATWCGPCQLEMPNIQEIHDQYGEEINVLLINAAEPPETIRSFLEDFSYTMPVARDERMALMGKWQLPYLPTSIFLDRHGRVCKIHAGYMNRDDMIAAADQARRGC